MESSERWRRRPGVEAPQAGKTTERHLLSSTRDPAAGSTAQPPSASARGVVAADTAASAALTVGMPRLLTQAQLAVYLGESEAWAERARWSGDGPPYVKLGRHVRYRAEDVEAWINAGLRTSTSAGGAT